MPRRPRRSRKPLPRLSHVERSSDGSHSVMVDVGKKPATEREALARARIVFPRGLRDRAWRGAGPKGAITEVARVAGILAAKRTSELVPMCHSLALAHVEVELRTLGQDRLEVRCRARTTGPTGVEMEAMVGASVAALTVYDMTKALSKEIAIERVELLAKSGGKSGAWTRRVRPE